MSNMLSKEEFIESDFGKGLVDYLRVWDEVQITLNKMHWGDPEFLEKRRLYDDIRAQWKIYSHLIEQLFGEEYFFIIDDEFYGIANQAMTDWIVKFIRTEPEPCATKDWRWFA